MQQQNCTSNEPKNITLQCNHMRTQCILNTSGRIAQKTERMPKTATQELPLKASIRNKDSHQWLHRLATQERQKKLFEHFGNFTKPVILLCDCDQVGTLRLLTDHDGTILQEIERDSFGKLMHNTLPELHLPLGLAGGLEDNITGLVRFSWRDYDPKTGRFTAPDPAMDMRGHGDVYA